MVKRGEEEFKFSVETYSKARISVCFVPLATVETFPDVLLDFADS